MQNSFNLIDEPWIPVAGKGKVSLKDIFSNFAYQSLGGNPVQKIAVFKLLLAISQAAASAPDAQQPRETGAAAMAKQCLSYLEKWHDRFYLYGERPFLQMPAIAAARALSFGAFLPEISTGNTTVLTQSQVEQELSDADRAMILLLQMGFALSGKKTDNSVVLSKGYAGKKNDKGKPSTGKPGPSVAHMGLLHSFVMLETVLESVWINTFTEEQIAKTGVFLHGVGQAPWEQMPEGEQCPVAEKLTQSYMGRLIPLSRFCLLSADAMHYSEGIAHANYKEGIQDFSVAINDAGKEPKALWANPDKRPWRELTSLLSFVEQGGAQGFQSWQLRLVLQEKLASIDTFSIWSGGLRVSSNAGEQYVSGSDDVVESQIWLTREGLGTNLFAHPKQEVSELDGLAKSLYGRILAYFKALTMDGKQGAAQATDMFWQLCERDFQSLVNHCDSDDASTQKRLELRRKFAAYQHLAYDFFCPSITARQIDAWADNRPNHSHYISLGAV